MQNANYSYTIITLKKKNLKLTNIKKELNNLGT